MAFVLLLVGILIVSPIYQEICEHAGDGTKRNCASYHIGLVALWKIGEALSDGTFVSGLITAIATAVIAWFTIVLARIGRRQSEDTRILQRAYVSANLGGIETNIEGVLVGHIIFENVGHLPAKDFSWRIKIAAHGGDRYPERLTDADMEENVRGVVTVGAKWRMGSGGLHPPQDGQTYEHIFVWGRAVYDDGFGKTRWTEFCHRYPWARREIPTGGGVRIRRKFGRYHKRGNDAD